MHVTAATQDSNATGRTAERHVLPVSFGTDRRVYSQKKRLNASFHPDGRQHCLHGLAPSRAPHFGACIRVLPITILYPEQDNTCFPMTGPCCRPFPKDLVATSAGPYFRFCVGAACFYKFHVCRMSLFSAAKLSSVFHPCKGEAHFLILFQFETPCFSTTVYKMRQSRHPVCTKCRLWRSKTELPRLKQHTEVLSGD